MLLINWKNIGPLKRNKWNVIQDRRNFFFNFPVFWKSLTLSLRLLLSSSSEEDESSSDDLCLRLESSLPFEASESTWILLMTSLTICFCFGNNSASLLESLETAFLLSTTARSFLFPLLPSVNSNSPPPLVVLSTSGKTAAKSSSLST